MPERKKFTPLLRIDLIEGRTASEITAIGGAIQRALVDCFDVPKRDQFQVIIEHALGQLKYNSGYLAVERTDKIVIVRIFLSSGRTIEQKQAFHARAAKLVSSATALRSDDVMIVLIENSRVDWSFGQGLAQYIVQAREQWQ